MVGSKQVASHRSGVWLLVLTLSVVPLAGCGDAGGNKETRKGELAALEKLPKFIQDDFKAGDENGDGRLQDSELEAMLEEDFKAADLNDDGEISAADIRKEAKDADVEASLAGLDIDKDGRVPIEEYAQHVERDFMKHMDTNKDGHLDPPEVAKFYTSRTGPQESK